MINHSHSVAADASRQALERVIPTGLFIRTQNPISLADSEPEPDLAVIRGRIRDYGRRHPGAPDVGLVMEISDTSLDRDRLAKKRIYAEARIPRYWLLDLNERKLEVYSGTTRG